MLPPLGSKEKFTCCAFETGINAMVIVNKTERQLHMAQR